MLRQLTIRWYPSARRASPFATPTHFQPVPKIYKHKFREAGKKDDNTDEDRTSAWSMRESSHFSYGLRGVGNQPIPTQDYPRENKGQKRSSGRRLSLHWLFDCSNHGLAQAR